MIIHPSSQRLDTYNVRARYGIHERWYIYLSEGDRYIGGVVNRQ